MSGSLGAPSLSASARSLAAMKLKPEIEEFALEEANEALVEFKTKRIRGAKVLRID